MCRQRVRIFPNHFQIIEDLEGVVGVKKEICNYLLGLKSWVMDSQYKLFDNINNVYYMLVFENEKSTFNGINFIIS